MKTYYHNQEGNFFRYFFDPNITSWTVLRIDALGNQVGHADYYANKASLLSVYPFFKFKQK
jgi:hypothetical protein